MAAPPQPTRKPGDKLARPKDAATVVIYRHGRKGIEVLMGERHQRHSFMPNRFVFPGGRVDPTDARVRVAAPLREADAAKLSQTATAARSRALAAAAVRETFEETGLLIAARDPAPDRSVPRNWRDFFALGIAPDLGALTYVARALTPPMRPIRFNARFFMIDAARTEGEIKSNGELLNLQFVPVPEIWDLEIASVTAKVAELVAERIDRQAGATAPIVYFKTLDGKTHTLIEE